MRMPRLSWRDDESDAAGDVGLDVLDDELDEDEDRPKKRWWKRDDSEAESEASQYAKQEWSGASVGLTMVARCLMWACVVMGPLALLLWFLTPAPITATSQPVAPDRDAGPRAAAGAFAEDFVTQWLSATRGDEQSLSSFVGDTAGIVLPDTPVKVYGASSSDFEKVGDVWAVTVAVTVMEGKPVAPVRRYFKTAVLYSAGAIRAQSYPAQVAAPGVAVPRVLGYPQPLGADHPIFGSSAAFLTAMLTGSGEVSRYTTPGVDIAEVAPPPYDTVTVTDLAVDRQPDDDPAASPPNGARVQALVTVEAAAAGNRRVSLQYALTLAARDGRWEVSAIDTTPALAPAAAEGEASTLPTKPTAAADETSTDQPN